MNCPADLWFYGTTTDFLRCFSFSSLGDLPELPNDQNTDRQLMLDEAVAESEKGENSSEKRIKLVIIKKEDEYESIDYNTCDNTVFCSPFKH